MACRNVPYNNTADWFSQAALISLSFSDQFKPGHLATVRGIRLINVTAAAGIRNPLVKSGSWRWFNFLGELSAGELKQLCHYAIANVA